jgi:soluble lytic murein transglycosylase-like protein
MMRSLTTAAVSASLALAALSSTPAHAQSRLILSAVDAQLYSAAFAAAEQGDSAAAEADIARVRDPCLIGPVRYVTLAAPAPRKAGYGDLEAWLKAFRDLPGANLIYALAETLKPPGAHPPTPSTSLLTQAAGAGVGLAATRPSPAARDAYFGGDMNRAYAIAVRDGDRWIAGLAAYRIGQFPEAQDHFSAVALDPTAADEARAGGAFWAARAARAAGQTADADAFTRRAASAPDTFYGMIARRRLELNDDPLDRVLQTTPVAQPIAATGLDAPGVRRLIETDPRAKRAIALMQIGRLMDAGLELRTGLALAVGDDERAAWTTLVLALNPSHPDASASVAISRRTASTLYPTPALDPLGGFVLSKALVYALTWQESRFNSLAVSPVGAIGLMQVMPSSMADVLGDDSLKSDPIPLFDPGTNLQAGQRYVTWLGQHAVGPDLLRVVAAYDGGPATVERTQTQVGLNDSLLIVESLPFAETRDYVHKVVAAYWSYRRQFGSDTPTLDAIASGAGSVDAALDR